MHVFPCRSCESPEMSVPRELTGSAIVRCGNCGATLGSWEAFRLFCADVVIRDAKASGRSPISGDPITVVRPRGAWDRRPPAPRGA